jgi:apolipoprotein N-acyltransferase
MGVAFLPLPLGFLAWCGLVPFLAALESRVRRGARARSLFALGGWYGLVFFLIGMHWIALLAEVAMTLPWVKYPAWVLAAAYLALFPALAALAAGTLARRTGWPLAIVVVPVWLAVEVMRGSGEMGFPWFEAGYSQVAYTPVVQLAALGGARLVTLWVLGLNVLLWRAGWGQARLRALAGAALLAAFAFAWGQRALDAAPGGAGPTVALVQGNVAAEIKWSGNHQPEILARFLTLSEDALHRSPRPALVIWPETATGSYLRKQLDQAIAVGEFASRTGVPVFSGYADWEPVAQGRPRTYNAAGLFSPDGSLGARYAKRHLVPFGERMPFQSLLPGLGRADFGQAEWTPGDSTVLFPSAAGPFSCLVCFESIFADLAREDVRHGARWIVNITNDEWFGRSAALSQHAAMAVFRAAENHVPLARCANTGLTLLVDSHGRITRDLPVFTTGVLVGPLGVPGRPTPFTRWGDWPGALACAAVLALAVIAAARALTGRPSPT